MTLEPIHLAIAAALTALVLFVLSQVQRRTDNDTAWMRQLIMMLRLAVLAFVVLYLYFRLTS